MGLLKPIKDLFYLNRAYVNTDINRLCETAFHLNDARFELTTSESDGIHLDKKVETQDIYADSRAEFGVLGLLNKEYVDMNSDIMSLNLCRCAVYIPVEYQPQNWYNEELELERIRGKYRG